MMNFLSWWFWRRWRIYCPKGRVDHLFTQHSLFHYDEAFVFPCCFNEVWCGGIKGSWTPKIQMISMPDND